MKLAPVLTEKSMNNAKEGKYTFYIDLKTTKFEVKKLVEETFGVHVTKVNLLKIGGENRKTTYGKKRKVMARKKAIVTLKEKEKIDLFEVKK